jgi:type II secretory pathway pseudopilin PulG
MITRTLRAGFSLLELMMFLGILAIISGTLTAVFINTQEARVRQQSVSEVEQRGTQLLETFTKTIRHAEAILAPASGQTGSILALQMALNVEFPTILSKTASGVIILVQKTSTAALLNTNVIAKNLTFKNYNGTNIVFSFDLQATIPLVHPTIYSRHFESTTTLFPDDQNESGGCTSCTAPSCTSHRYHWYTCESGVCTQATQTIAC